ncbi:MAG TPA: hypothetical protein VK669_00070 [Candidatus Limnocylindrales bacterium]|nr:hypothetical protein [Candidatus Limnocylindrales bacterium]
MSAAERPAVLFVCIHNSARSQIAEAFVNERYGDRLRAYSAGLEAGALNPMAVEVMREAGVDISGNRSKSVNDPEIRARGAPSRNCRIRPPPHAGTRPSCRRFPRPSSMPRCERPASTN